MAPGDYDYKPSGSLKFKGGGDEKKKKKKKSSTSEKIREEGGSSSTSKDKQRETSSSTDVALRAASRSMSPGEGSAALASAKIEYVKPTMTESERRYEEVRRQRLEKKVKKEALKSHKDRVAEFNEKLESLSEHHDLPRIGPG